MFELPRGTAGWSGQPVDLEAKETMTANQFKEAYVRFLKVPSTDKNWEGCKENWMKPDSIKWLDAKAKRKLKHYKP